MVRRLALEPISLVCGGLSFTLLHVYSLVVALTLPSLFELWSSWPHVAWTLILALISSPAWAVALLHRIGHGVIDVFDKTARESSEISGKQSLWAGFFAWMVLFVASTLTTLILLAIQPPERPEPDMLRSFANVATSAFAWRGVFTLHSLVWVAIASFLHQLERSIRTGA
jgi:hypothetical protein